MKFSCDRCQTKYTISDERVRGKVLKIRCKTCANVITIRESQGQQPAATLRAVPLPQPAIVAPLVATETPEPAVVTPAPAVSPPPSTAPAAAEAQLPDADQWYLSIDGQRFGPYELTGIAAELTKISSEADVYVWHPTFDGWVSPEDVSVVQDALDDLKNDDLWLQPLQR